MSLGKQLVERLRGLGGDARRERPVLVESGGVSYYSTGIWLGPMRAVLEFGDHDRFSVTLRALEIGTGRAPDAAPQEYLSERAARIAERLSYLEEPLVIWELSGDEGVAQLRSGPPQRDGDMIGYWEIVLKAGEEASARLSRYEWRTGSPDRALAEYPATFSTLGRIADDLAACLA